MLYWGMFHFPYLSFVLVLSLILVAGFLAFNAEGLNREKTEAEAVERFVTGLLVQTRRDYAQERDFSLLGSGIVYFFEYEGLMREVRLVAKEEGFAFRFARVPDVLCAFLVRRYISRADIKVIESEAVAVNWRAGNSSTLNSNTGHATCYGARNNRFNGLELSFVQ